MHVKKDSVSRLNRFIIISAFLLISGVLMINFFYYKSNEEVFRRGLSDTTMPVIADAISSSMKDINNNYALVARLFAASFDRMLLSAEREDADVIHNYLNTWSQILDVKNIGIVSLKSGRYYDLEQELILDFNSDRDGWISDFLADGNDYRYSLYDPDDEYAPLYSFFHDFKVRDMDDRVVGIAGLGLSYDKFFDRAKSVHEGIEVSFLDSEGHFRLPLHRREQDMDALYGIDFSSCIDQLEGEDCIRWGRRHDGRDFLLLIRYLPEIHRRLLIELDVSDVLMDYKKKSMASVLAVFLLSLAVVSASLLIYTVSSRRLTAKVYHDTLTGCYNREYLERHFSRSSAVSARQVSPTLIIFDIDYFKEVNDRKGHKAGDRLLKRVSQIVRKQLRAPDAVIRWGGDEFVLLLYCDDSSATRLAERIRAAIEEETDVTISVGLSRLNGNEDFSRAFDRADEALYRAKESGRNRVVSNY